MAQRIGMEASSIHQQVRREKLLSTFAATSEFVVLMVAPGGYGKTVLASQIAALPEFDMTIWVEANGVPLGEPCVVQSILEALRESERKSTGVASSYLQPGSSRDELLAELRADLAGLSESSVCVVLDNLVASDISSGILEVAACFRGAGASSSRILITTRGVLDDIRPVLAASWTIEANDLRMSREEARSLLDRVLEEVDDQMLDSLLDASSGQVALLAVLARHLQDDPSLPSLQWGVPLDLAGKLEQMALEHLGDGDLAVLYAGALLARGTELDLRSVLGAKNVIDLNRIADCIPLISLELRGQVPHFRFHDYACHAFSSPRFTDAISVDLRSIREGVISLLDRQQSHGRLFALLMRSGTAAELVNWLELRGVELLQKGQVAQLEVCLSAVSASRLLSRPKLVVLQAGLLREQNCSAEAVTKASVARELAEHNEDHKALCDSLLLLARLSMDAGSLESARAHLEQILSLPRGVLGLDTRGLVYAYLVICCAQLGFVEDAIRFNEAGQELVAGGALSPFVWAYILHASTIISGLVEGEWHRTLAPLRRIATHSEVPAVLRLMASSNEACALTFMGRVSAGSRVLDDVTVESEELGLEAINAVARSCRALNAAAAADYDHAEELIESLGHIHEIDAASAAQDYAFQAQWRRACGDFEQALHSAERSLHLLDDKENIVMMRGVAELEFAACLVALGEEHRGVGVVESARRGIPEAHAKYHMLVAELIRSEVARRDDRFSEAVSRLLEHAEYIRTESANLVIAFYIRAFPGLLGVLAEAVGSDRLPAHLLRLIGHRESLEALRLAWGVMPRESWQALAERLVEDEDIDRLVVELEDRAPCQVRLFGGLGVTTPDGVIPDRAWRKRKARLLLAMLVSRHGQDVPREQLLDYLWPDLPEEKARNNFYVVWNTLKGALSPNLPKGENCPYIESIGGLVRVAPDLVRSDLDDFNDILELARDAETDGDAETAINAYRRLEEVYQGDLLPGDVYDDWFGPLRERCRQQFGDAMLRAARLLDEQGRREPTLHTLRLGLGQDPRREDLYQEMLKQQIALGMRSAAIETYMACRIQLSEELGLDPSSETRLLYDRVLAMEEDVEPYAEIADGGYTEVRPC